MARFDNTDRLPHACLVCASTREAALSAAETMARAAVCSGIGKKPCGVCRDCVKAQKNVHPDVIRISRLSDDKGRKKQQIGVDQIREITADAYILPNEAQRKVYIIDEAETMNAAAQNAALKLLEEPPAGAVFLLCTVNAMQLLPTVRSRCAEYNPAEESVDGTEISEAAAEYIRLVSAGDEARLLRWCAANEGMAPGTADELLTNIKTGLADALCVKQKQGNISRQELFRLTELIDKCRTMLQVNTGVKHIFGLLAVDSVSGGETEEQQIDQRS